jgi:hypothetical protein
MEEEDNDNDGEDDNNVDDDEIENELNFEADEPLRRLRPLQTDSLLRAEVSFLIVNVRRYL